MQQFNPNYQQPKRWQQNSSASTDTHQHRSTSAEYVWHKLSEFYGEQWTKSAGITPNQSWIDALNTLETHQIKLGLAEIVKQGKEWPPSLPAFVKLCRSSEHDDSFDRFISRLSPANYAEFLTANSVGYRCRTQLPEEKARALWSKTLQRFKAKIDRGEVPAAEKAIQAPAKEPKPVMYESRTTALDRQIDQMLAAGQRLIGPFKKRYEERQKHE